MSLTRQTVLNLAFSLNFSKYRLLSICPTYSCCPLTMQMNQIHKWRPPAIRSLLLEPFSPSPRVDWSRDRHLTQAETIKYSPGNLKVGPSKLPELPSFLPYKVWLFSNSLVSMNELPLPINFFFFCLSQSCMLISYKPFSPFPYWCHHPFQAL